MRTILVFPRSHFQSLLLRLSDSPLEVLRCRVGMYRFQDETRYLVRTIESTRPLEKILGRFIYISTTEKPFSFSDFITNFPEIKGIIGYLILGREKNEGYWWGAINEDNADLLPISEILLIGSEMPILKMSPFSDKKAEEQLQYIDQSILHQWSRTIGALGKTSWQRLTSLSIAIIGCGRSGSIAAVTLAKLGVQNLILIDPDKVESHNLPEMDGVTESDIGKYKVETVSEYLKNCYVASGWPVTCSIYTQLIVEAYREALKADILVSCVDNNVARLACGILATLYHKILLEISTGVLPSSNSKETTVSPIDSRIGADIRLIIPGYGCLRCFGSVTNYEEAIKELAKISSSPETPWWANRLGSLRTLNMVAVHIGIQLLCDLVGGRVQQSRWTQLEYTQQGEIRIQQQIKEENDSSCPLCAKSGMGDDGLCW